MTNQGKIQEMQLLEQNLQNLLLQKQAFQLELAETQSALREIGNAGDEIFKLIGQLMLKTEKSKIQEELSNKEKLLELRLKNIEKQESQFTDRLDKLREEFIRTVKK